ncbi:hypothetical protein [Amycolatopsis balhimycina]|uniref:hypothetical protein n=1 Tax=Amycolatopsis balhimycina TaxID=208443 RepID=UPI0003A7E633|nr:hypothetical protein [Amycolatopsis balhimycina]
MSIRRRRPSGPEGVRGEVVEAFVVLTDEAEANNGLAADLQRLVRDEYSKVQRYLLRQR